MTKTLKDLLARGESHRFRTEARLDEFLDGERLSAEQRLAFKLEMLRTGRWQPQGPTLRASLATDEAVPMGSLATDRSDYRTPTPTSEVTRLLEKAKLPPDRAYTLAEVEARLQTAGLTVEERIACKHELSSLGLLRR